MTACSDPKPAAATAAPANPQKATVPAAAAAGKACPAGLTLLDKLPVCGKLPAELVVRTPPNIGGVTVAEWGIKDSHTSVRITSEPYNSGMFYDQNKRNALAGNGGQLMEQGTFPDDGVWATFKYSGETRQAIYAVLHDADTKVECIAMKETAESAPPDAAAMFAICKGLVLAK